MTEHCLRFRICYECVDHGTELLTIFILNGTATHKMLSFVVDFSR